MLRLLIGVLLGPLGGSLADRWRLRPTLVATNLLQILALAPLLVVDSERVWPVFIVVVAQGMISSVNDPASFALLPRLVSGERLIAANSAMSAGGSIARLIGAAAGGIALSAGGMPAVAVLDGATFAVGALAAGLMSAATNQSAIDEDSDDEPDTSIRSGLRTIRSLPGMAALLWVQTLAMVGFGIFPVVFIVFVNAPSATTALWLYLALFALTGFPNVATQVGTRSTAQVLSPPEVLGRLGGLMSASTALGMGIGSTAAGLLLEITGARTVFNGQVAILLACGAISVWFVARPIGRTEADRDKSVPAGTSGSTIG